MKNIFLPEDVRCSSLQVVGYPIYLAVNTILLVMLYLTYNLSIQCPFLIFDCLPGFVSPYNQITLVSGGTQGRVSLSLPKALLNTLIRVRSRALAAFRGTFCQIRQKYVYELYFAPFPHHPLLSFSSPWSGLTSSNTHPLSPNPPPGCPISQLRGRGQDIPRGLLLPPMGSSADSAGAPVHRPGDRSRERRTGSSGAPGRPIVGRRT